MKRQNEELFAVTAPGLEDLCARELEALGIASVKAVPGGVEFSGELRQIYAANLWSRTAGRVLVRFAEFRCRDFPALFNRVSRLPWGRFVRPGTTLSFRAASHRSRLMHTGRMVEVLQEAAAKALGENASADRSGSEQLVLVRFEDDLCRISIDSSGELLHRRGYREEAAHAPMRETLAAGTLLRLGWDGTTGLYDPLCGSGTFLIEAALIATHRPPGAGRPFAFMNWPGYRPGLWDALLMEASRQQKPLSVSIAGSDRDALAVSAARRNVSRAGFSEFIEVQPLDIRDLELPPGGGWVVTNPPYGERVGAGQDLRPLYARLGGICRAGWSCALVCPDSRQASVTGLSLSILSRFSNGGIEVYLHAMSENGEMS